MAGDATVIAETTNGRARGHRDGDVVAWRGIPYAAAPVGELRFRAPRPAPAWEGVRDCADFGPICPQAGAIPIESTLVADEDCLNLNVWAPGDSASPRPVLVWIHGGAYYMGAGSQGMYSGRRLAEDGDAVVVTINYRLGVLGFVDLASVSTPEERFDVNVGLRDQIAALEWVRDNIAAFGGDPANVTLFGESSGGGSVTTLMTVPRAEGLFHRAIAQSSPATSVYGSERAAVVAGQLLGMLGIDRDDVGELRRLSAQRLAQAGGRLATEVFGSNPGTLAIAPVVDRDLVLHYPVAAFQKGLQHRIPLVIGTNRDEASIFRLLRLPMMPVTPDSVYRMFAAIVNENPEVPPEKIAAVVSGYPNLPRTKGAVAVSQDAAFRMPAVWIAEAHSRIAPTWLYRFDYAAPMLRAARVGAGHATEIPYLFGTFGVLRRDATFLLGGRNAAETVADRMRGRWLAFATGGKPEGSDTADGWPEYDERGRLTMIIDRGDSVVPDPDRRMRLVWGGDVVGFP